MSYTSCATREIALQHANALVGKLKGAGWKPVVFENVGWHWQAVSGPVQVYPAHTKDLRYWCMVGSGPKDSAGGAGFWTPQGTKDFKDPNRAVRDAMRHVYEFVDRINQTVAAAERAMGVKPSTKEKRK